MVSKIIVCLLVASLLYVYTNHTSEFTATASVVRQIWSGSCHLSCRQSEYGGFSGLSALNQGQSQDNGSRLSEQIKQPTNYQAGPSGICVCETCPCAILEKVLKTCSPATNLYFQVIEILSNFYYEAVRASTDLYGYMEQVVSCRASCQRPAQLTALKLSSSENINLIKASPSVKDDSAKKLDKKILNLKPSAISFRRQSKDDLARVELRTSTGGHNIALNQHRDSSKPKSESKDPTKVSESCSRCIEKGKVCINNCPRSKDKH